MPKFKADQGPKSIFEKVTSILIGDTVLKGLVKFTASNPNIRRAYQPSGQWKTLVIYYLQPEYTMENFSPNIRQVPMIVMIYNRENDLDLTDIAERVIQLLHEADLTKQGYVFVYNCLYTGELGSTYYDDKEKAYVKTLRFMVTFRKEEEGHA
jgi:hypothetical protein